MGHSSASGPHLMPMTSSAHRSHVMPVDHSQDFAVDNVLYEALLGAVVLAHGSLDDFLLQFVVSLWAGN